MTSTQKFIEDAIAGGWGGKWDKTRPINIEMLDHMLVGFSYLGSFEGVKMSVCDILLQPGSWQAVGKTRGWDDDRGTFFNKEFLDKDNQPFLVPAKFFRTQNSWLFHQHHFLDYLALGKTIDEALTAIA